MEKLVFEEHLETSTPFSVLRTRNQCICDLTTFLILTNQCKLVLKDACVWERQGPAMNPVEL